MKKILCVLCVLAVGVTSLAAKPRFGVDFAWGVGMGFQNMDFTSGSVKANLERIDITIPAFKVSTYDYFLLNNMFGVHASFSYSPIGFNLDPKLSISGQSIKASDSLDDLNLQGGIEFLIGPAFGVNLGSKLRFQTGLDFHLLFTEEYEVETTIAGHTEKHDKEAFTSMGLALTPQLRFTPNKLFSFILGCDFVFDFAVDANFIGYKPASSRSSEEITLFDSGYKLNSNKIDKYFRFGMTPYLGFGLNF